MIPFKIKFGIPRHGWMEVAFGDRSMTVSDMPCDSLHGLIKCMRNFLTGSKREKVEWSLEPEYESWIFERHDGYTAIHIVDPKGRTISTTTNAEAFFSLLIEELKKCHDRSFKNNPEINTHWSWDFPYDDLRDLQKNVAESGR